MKIQINPNGRSLGLTQADLGRQVRQAITVKKFREFKEIVMK